MSSNGKLTYEQRWFYSLSPHETAPCSKSQKWRASIGEVSVTVRACHAYGALQLALVKLRRRRYSELHRTLPIRAFGGRSRFVIDPSWVQLEPIASVKKTQQMTDPRTQNGG